MQQFQKKETKTEKSIKKTREMGTQTNMVSMEKSIIPSIYKNKTVDTQSDNTEETSEGIDSESVENIFQQLGKKVISSGNTTFIVEFLEALIKSITKKEVNESHSSPSSSGPVEQSP